MLNESATVRRQQGRVVKAANWIGHGSPEFKSSAMPVNSQLVCLRPVGILNLVMWDLIIYFMYLLGPASIRIFFILSFFLKSVSMSVESCRPN